MFRELRSSLILFVILMLLTGLGYPLLMLVIGQNVFPLQANGSLIKDNGKVIGSHLIAQNFVGAGYFHPRPSAAGNGYDAGNSSASNQAPSSEALVETVRARVMQWRKSNNNAPVPIDLVTTSASGLDPDISVAAAKFQASGVAAARRMDMAKIEGIITQHTYAPTFGLLGENRVNVLELNRALDHAAVTDLSHEPE